MCTGGEKVRESPFVDPAELDSFQKANYPGYYWWVVFHKLLRHGIGRMVVEDSEGNFDFDIYSPLASKPITTWYNWDRNEEAS